MSFADTAFVDAAACGDLAEVVSLLRSESPLLSAASINSADKDGKTAFHYGCLNDDANLLKVLLPDPRVDVACTSRNGDTGLHMAALYSSLEAINLLCADGRISVNAQNKFGETPLHLCAGSGDKAAARTAKVLLGLGASLTVLDKWRRGPIDVSHDNAENPIVATFVEYLNDRSTCSQEEYDRVMANSAAYKAEVAEAAKPKVEADSIKSKAAAISIFGQLGAGGLGGVKLKKTETVLKTMFKAGEGQVKEGAVAASNSSKDSRRPLSKLIDFPGDLNEIQMHLQNPEISPAGFDAYGLTALHKFASWNKTDYLDLLLPHLSGEELEAKCPEGKTALHYAVEMASVAAVRRLVAAGVNLDATDGKGRTVRSILESSPPSGIIERLRLALIN